MQEISRQEAKRLGLSHYFTGVACKHGHISKRRTSNSTCFECHLAVNAAWRISNPEYMRDWGSRNKDAVVENNRKRYERNKPYVLGKCKEYREANRGKVTAGWMEWAKANPDKLREIQRRYEGTANGRMIKFMRRSVARTLSGAAKDDTSRRLLGYTHHELVSHIEAQFESWMNWGNHGVAWHIDHIIPVSKFVADGCREPSVVNALKNLRPLCAKMNMQKGSRIERENV